MTSRQEPSRRGPALSIADLVAATAVPPATVHYYLRHGLLPKPARIAPNRFAYDERHVHALRLIRSLRDKRGLSLPMIRRILPELMALEQSDAFRPEMWDRAMGPRMPRSERLPSARLLRAAEQAFAQRGYDEVNVDELCRAARIAKGSFYRHYRSKEDLFLAVAERAATDVAARFAESTGGEAVTANRAGATLGPIVRPVLPIFLELTARAVQRKPGYQATLRRILAPLSRRIGQSVSGEGDAAERGTRALGAAVAAVVIGTFSPESFDTATGPGGESHTKRATG